MFFITWWNIFPTFLKKNNNICKKFTQIENKFQSLECGRKYKYNLNIKVTMEIKKQIINMINRGKEEKDILIMLKNNYGDFVNFEPPIKINTFLWLEPFIMLMLSFKLLLKKIKEKSC